MASILLTKVHLDFKLVIKATVMVNNNLDYYRYINNNFHFCKSYYDMIIKKKIPKFGSANYINVWLCQKYPDVFSDLTFVEKVFIACAHLIISIIKLRRYKIA